MKKIDPIILRETGFVVVSALIMSVIMQGVFIVIGRWDHSVLIGNAAGLLVSCLNFFLLGLSTQSAVSKDQADARNTVRLSHSLRFFMIIAVAGAMFLLNRFGIIPVNFVALLIPILFPGTAYKLRAIFIRNEDKEGTKQK